MHYILTLDGKESEGAYAVTGQDGSKILQIFEERDDAERFVGLLDAMEHPPMTVYEIECEQAIAACENFGYNYTIITPDDFVIPTQEEYDYI
jgi:hypothetical protein|tara:strand:+ start:993 stop:1268 length:276 start_codon:yes stop_codon:yes gene_type:complete